MSAPLLITSKSNARVKALRASFSGKAAQPGDRLGLEGEHLIAEAIRSGLSIEALFLRQGSHSLLHRPALAHAAARVAASSTFTLSPDVFVSAVETASPQGIAATVHIPALPLTPLQPQAVVLVLEGLQDPGNLGTLLRTAEAFAAQQVYLTPDTVNPWNPKVVRASAGSVFRIPVARAPLADIAQQLHGQGTRIYAAVAQSHGADSLLHIAFAPRVALLIGNEGSGLSAQALALAHQKVCIPCAVESLNAAVAGATLLYEALRQRLSSTNLAS
ncbi:MAG: TrmH family RNA methyltransferase [Acidobacteriaceae bacterium]